MANKKRIALKNVPAVYFENGISKIRTQTPQRSVNSLQQLVWHQHKWEIGSRIDVNVIEPQLKRTGKLPASLLPHSSRDAQKSQFLKRRCRALRKKSTAENIIN